MPGQQYRRWQGRAERPLVFAWLIAAVAATCVVAGGYMLWLHCQSSQPQAYRASAGVLLTALGAWQLRLAWSLARRSQARHEYGLHGRLIFWRWLFAGAVLCYLAGLVLGPDPSVGYFFCAALTAWYTGVLWLLADRPALVSRLSDRLRWRWAKQLGGALFASLFTVFAAEGSLRLYVLATGDRLPAAYVARTHALQPGEMLRGRVVNSLGYWDDEFRREPQPGMFRIAVLGDALLLSGDAKTNCLEQVERMLPGVEIYNFAIPEAGPREYAAQWSHEAAAFRPDLVLTCVSVGDDLTNQLPLPGAFDWRGLRLYQFGAGTMSLADRPRCAECDTCDVALGGDRSREAYLRAGARRLAVCRTPIDEHMSRRWRETAACLEDLRRACQSRQTPLALMLVPGEFQLSGTLCEALCHQAGCQMGQLDLDLPQRRLTVFAEDRELPVLDLLPHFRAATEFPHVRNDRQWNDHGNTVAARALGQWLQSRFGSQIAANQQARHP